MKNSFSIQREFGEVLLKLELPSVEAFFKKVSNNTIIAARQIIDVHHNWCPDIVNFYTCPDRDIASEFNQNRLPCPHFTQMPFMANFSDASLVYNGYINIAPLFGVDISAPKIVRFRGIYNEDILTRVNHNIKDLIAHIISFRKPVTFAFEIEEVEDKPKIITI